MIDRSQFSRKILAGPEGNSDESLARIATAKRRIQSILDRDTVACQKTLEQKIAEQGPRDMRVDPHLIGRAILDLSELKRLVTNNHAATGRIGWFSNSGRAAAEVTARLNFLAPLYDSVSGHGFGNLTGDALELIVWKSLREVQGQNRRFTYQGHFDLTKPKNTQGRYHRIQPPKNMGEHTTKKEADFFQFGHAAGALCIECKNLLEWIYPDHVIIKELIIKSSDLQMIPVLIARRLHYTTRNNLLYPAGIMAHESLYQYYPADHADLAAQVRHARNLGFTDVLAVEEPHARTQRFFGELLPGLAAPMAAKWNKHQSALVAFANEEIKLHELYREIDSPAASSWSADDDGPTPADFDF
jgi:hypothetical protein